MYAMPCGITATSLIHNMPPDTHLHLHIFCQLVGIANRQRFLSLAQTPNIHITLYPVDEALLAAFPHPVDPFYPRAIYLRLLLGDLLPADIHRILYLDCDTLCCDNITPLFNTPLEDKVLGAVPDQACDDTEHRLTIGLDDSSNYYNSGVLLINLEQWRKVHAGQTIAQLLQLKGKDYPYPDQDAINILYSQHIQPLPFRYNTQYLFFCHPHLMRMRDNMKPLAIEASRHPAIIHFQSEIKPWMQGCDHPHTPLFLHYKSQSPWASVPLLPPKPQPLSLKIKQRLRNGLQKLHLLPPIPSHFRPEFTPSAQPLTHD